jgi:hypothetical protein
MMTPEYIFPQTKAVYAAPNSGVNFTFNMQIPTATNPNNYNDCQTYASMDLIFVPIPSLKSTVQIAYEVSMFFNHHGWVAGQPVYNISQDPKTKDLQMLTPLVTEASAYVQLTSGFNTGTPWKGFKPFNFTITYNNFQNGLKALAGSYSIPSTNPSDWLLSSVHMNTEMQILGCPAIGSTNPAGGTFGPVELGWSMGQLKINQLTNMAP